MNKKRRDSLRTAVVLLKNVSGIISKALDEEQDCLDNMPENLQDSERCLKMEFAIEKLEDAIEEIENATENIEDACS